MSSDYHRGGRRSLTVSRLSNTEMSETYPMFSSYNLRVGDVFASLLNSERLLSLNDIQLSYLDEIAYQMHVNIAQARVNKCK